MTVIPMDKAEIGQIAMALMDDIGDDGELGTVMVSAEVETEDDVTLVARCSDSRAWVKIGLLEASLIGARGSLEAE